MSPKPARRLPDRLSPGSFAVSAVGVYFLSFVSQVLLSAGVTARASIVPFALVQIGLIAIWIVLHRRRLRDAGRPLGIVNGIAAVYALEIVLLIILVWFMLEQGGGGVGPEASILNLFVILYFLTMLTGDAHLGALQIWIFGFVVVMLAPIAIAVGFSAWAATRPSTFAAS